MNDPAMEQLDRHMNEAQSYFDVKTALATYGKGRWWWDMSGDLFGNPMLGLFLFALAAFLLLLYIVFDVLKSWERQKENLPPLIGASFLDCLFRSSMMKKAVADFQEPGDTVFFGGLLRRDSIWLARGSEWTTARIHGIAAYEVKSAPSSLSCGLLFFVTLAVLPNMYGVVLALAGIGALIHYSKISTVVLHINGGRLAFCMRNSDLPILRNWYVKSQDGSHGGKRIAAAVEMSGNVDAEAEEEAAAASELPHPARKR